VSADELIPFASPLLDQIFTAWHELRAVNLIFLLVFL